MSLSKPGANSAGATDEATRKIVTRRRGEEKLGFVLFCAAPPRRRESIFKSEKFAAGVGF